jgi:hypothetical protein
MNTWLTSQTFRRIFFGLADGYGINDTSSQAFNGSTFWSYNMSRFNRVFVGLSGSIDGNNVPQSPTVLSSTYSYAWSQNAQLAVTSAMGLLAITGLARASDWVTYSGSASQGTEAIVGFGHNDDTTTAGGSIVVGGNLIGTALSGAKGITIGTQNDINVASTTVVIDPYTGFPSGTTIATLCTPGAYSSAATQNPSAGLVIGPGYGGGPVFNAGIVLLDGTVASLGGAKPVMMALPRNTAIVWYSSPGTRTGSLFVDSGGNFNITSSGNLIYNGITMSVP